MLIFLSVVSLLVGVSLRCRRHYQPLSHLQPQLSFDRRSTYHDDTAREHESGVEDQEEKKEGHEREDVTEKDETVVEDGEEGEDTMERKVVSRLRKEKE